MEHIADRIKSYLAADKDNVVAICTMTKATVIQQKHIDKYAAKGYEFITKPKDANDPGFWMQQGKSKVYVSTLGCQIRFGGYR
jgi:hypothetical protein